MESRKIVVMNLFVGKERNGGADVQLGKGRVEQMKKVASTYAPYHV